MTSDVFPVDGRLTSPVVAFLIGDGRDLSGSSLDDILNAPNEVLESRHDFIQWLFPLDQPSRAVSGSPVLTPADVASIRKSGRATANIVAAAARMKRFYLQTVVWRRGPDHNHLRITRIIKSLRLLVSDSAADGFKQFVQSQIHTDEDNIPAATISFWNLA